MSGSASVAGELVEMSGAVYGIHVEGRLPTDFAPFLRPSAGGWVDPERRLSVSYRTVVELPPVEEIWASEPRDPALRDRFSLFRDPEGFGLAVDFRSRGLFRICPRQIAIEWSPDGRGAAHFFYSHVLPLWLESQGVTVLHASAVSLADRAVAFAGPSGVGKSTLCAELTGTGWDFVADDGLPFEETDDGQWRCRRGPAWLRLWPSALEGRLGVPAEGLRRVHDTLDKRWLPVGAGEGAEPEREPEVVPGPRLAAIYLLERQPAGTGEPVTISRCSPGESLLRLVEHSLGAAPLAALGLSAARLDRLARLAAELEVRRLRFSSDDPPGAVGRVIREDLGLGPSEGEST